jgi:hypothetical protein
MLNIKEKNKKIYFIVFLLLGISILFFLLICYFKSSIVLEKKEFTTSLSIGNSTGFNVTNYSISFGMLSRDNAASRNDISVKNFYEFPIFIEISLEGDIKDLLIYNDRVYLEPNESKNLNFSTIEITNQKLGDYTGIFSLVFKKVRT